jgi:hypothetical protein
MLFEMVSGSVPRPDNLIKIEVEMIVDTTYPPPLNYPVELVLPLDVH